MAHSDLFLLKPFEICSIRPPTENSSITFRLTRNCYWNKCKFCPVYKFNARFSKRQMGEVLEDITRAKNLDDAMFEHGIGYPVYSEADFHKAADFIDAVTRALWEAGILDESPVDAEAREDLDPRITWFLGWFKEKTGIGDCVHHLLTWRFADGKNCFLGDSDSLILKPDFISRVTGHAKLNFPSIERFTIYGRIKTANTQRSFRELVEIHESGIERIHLGLESGHDEVLTNINKGVTRSEIIEGLVKSREAGFSVSVYVMPGLGGRDLSEAHAADTADVINRTRPHFVRIRSLEVFPMTPLSDDRDGGRFVEADEDAVVNEIRIMVQSINTDLYFFSDSASNLLSINGRLPMDRGRMLSEIDEYLSLSPRIRREYSLQSRLQAFYGQYGQLSEDIMLSILPFVKNGRIKTEMIPDQELNRIIFLVRSKLMP